MNTSKLSSVARGIKKMNFEENKISHFFAFATKFIPARFYPQTILGFYQGNNARKVISEVYASFVL